jgi:hypothetical protein
MTHGFFSGNPQTEWLTNAAGKDRDMQLLQEFSYTDPDAKKWLAPKGVIINGASIPEFLWSTVGSPYTDDYRRASIVHDVACGDPAIARKDADTMFYHACRAGGCGIAQARVLYTGVRLGAWASTAWPSPALPLELKMARPLLASPEPEELFLRSKLSAIAAELQALDATDTVDAVDAIIARHVTIQE